MWPIFAWANIRRGLVTRSRDVASYLKRLDDSESIVQYLKSSYGPKVQLVVSVRIQHWINEHGNKNIHMVSDQGFDRVDRPRWKSDVDKCLTNQSFYQKNYDAHLPGSPFKPDVWDMMKPLVHLMYGVNWWQAAWADDYAKGIFRIMSETRLL
jgi:hypothetical protein